MLYVLLVVVLIALIAGPQLWARRVLDTYNRDEYFSGTGKELAAILITDLKLAAVTVEDTDNGDHYDPFSKTVRLNPQTTGKRSLTAVVVAAHEVGHAMQDAWGDGLLAQRTRLVEIGVWCERIGMAILMAAPVVGALMHLPVLNRVYLFSAAAVMVIPVVVHLVTLPVEFDASFNKALPVLLAGRYIPPDDEAAARRILTACALTYVAVALASIFNLWRWLRVFRR